MNNGFTGGVQTVSCNITQNYAIMLKLYNFTAFNTA